MTLKTIPMKLKMALYSVFFVIIGFIILCTVNVNFIEKNITDTMVKQFINENSQIAKQASILIEGGASVEDLQKFVHSKVEDYDYIAYAIVIDKTVTAIAHSDEEKIGKNYSDDTSYSVPAATQGAIMESKFWADVQNAWTFDIMYPIYVNGELFGSMDVGIYNSEVSAVISKMKMLQIIISIFEVLGLSIIFTIISSRALKPLNQFTAICVQMGNGDFSISIDEKLLARHDELGSMAKAIENMKKNLASLINNTTQNAKTLFDIADKLKEGASHTEQMAANVANKAHDALNGSERQKEVVEENSVLTGQISESMSNAANSIVSVSNISKETSIDAKNGSEQIDNMVKQMHVIEKNVDETYDKIQMLDEMSIKIQEVVNIIDEISEQTNLLALNASIEAARAGEQGKGFSVVAGEVGKLAIQSQSATGDIRDIITNIQACIKECVQLMENGDKSVKEGMSLASKVDTRFNEIKEKILQVSNDMDNISAITKQADADTANLQDKMNEILNIANDENTISDTISDATKQMEERMKLVFTQVDELTLLSQKLEETLSVFKI